MSRLRRFLAGDRLLSEVAKRAADTALAEALAKGLIDPDENDYVRMGASKRDLASVTHSYATEQCFKLYQQTPIGHRITELNRDFIVGDGLTYSCRNPDVEEIVAEWWHDDQNNLDQRTSEFALDLGLYGELVPEAFVGETSGVMRLGYIDVADIKAVEHEKGNPLVPDVVRVKSLSAPVNGKKLDVIRDRGNGYLEGQVFYFRVNAVSNATRGWPDLLHVADWVDAYDALLWEILERSRLIRTFIWDVLLKGASPNEITDFLRKHGKAPKSGTVLAHNEDETWQAVAPELGSFETAKEADVILQHIAAGSGFPKTWLASAEDVNRATAQVMDVPTVRRLAARQRYYSRCMHRMTRFVLERAEKAGRLKTTGGFVQVFNEDGEPATDAKNEAVMARPHELVEIQAPEISPRDMASAGELLSKVSNALAVAETQGWIGKQPIRQVLASLFSMLGYDYEPTDSPEDDTDKGSEEVEEEPRSRKDMEEGVRALVARGA